MFKTKKDVDRHVSDIARKLQNENERNLRGLSFARLYFQVKEYDMALRYVTGFLSVRENHPEAHKLMAQIAETNGNFEKAVQSYKRSLELDGSQKDVVLKICKLYCQLPVDPDTARYWADRGEKLFPNHEAVFRLRECLVSADGEPNHHELEQLIKKELESRPRDVGLHIKLLKLYTDTERVQQAYVYAVEIEEKRPFPFSVDWYFCLTDICEAFQEECEQQVTVDFYICYLAVLDHLVSLVLAESHVLVSPNDENANQRGRNIVDSASILHTFDQQLKRCTQAQFSQEGAWLFILNHMKGQLYLHLATLLLKRAKKDHGNWKEACRHAAALLLVAYSFKPGNPHQEMWFSASDSKRSTLLYFQKAGAARLSCTGHAIGSLCKEDKTKWLQKIKQETCLPQVRDKIYQRAFSVVGQKQFASKSYFLQDGTFLECALEFPSQGSLLEYDKVFYKLYSNCLHHLVWLLLHRGPAKLIQTCHNFQLFEGLQNSTAVLTSGAPESLSQLDIEAFLCATTYTANLAMEQRRALIHRNAGDYILCLPPDIVDPLCTEAQNSWWRAAYSLYTNAARLKLSELRQILRRGLEVIRGLGNHGMDVNLVVYLARAFADQAVIMCKAKGQDASNPLEERAAHYWTLALSMLDGLMSNRRPPVSKERLFASYNREPSTREVASLREEGRFYLAARDMNQGHLEDAAKAFETLNSAYASYYLASTLKNIAREKQNDSNSQEDCVALLTKARDSLFLTMDRISGDKKHPLNAKLQGEVEELELKLSESRTDGIDSYDETEEEDASARIPNGYTPDRSREGSASVPTSTPLNTSYTHVRPSPERLDAQIRALTYTQENLVRILTEQQQALIEKNKEIVEELKQNKAAVEDMKKQLEEIQKTSSNVCPRCEDREKRSGSKKDVQKDDNDDSEERDKIDSRQKKEPPKAPSSRQGKVAYPEETDEPEYPNESEGYPVDAPSLYPTRRLRKGIMKGQDTEDGYEGNDYGDPYYDYTLDGDPAAYGYVNGFSGLVPGMGYLHQPPVMLQYPHHYPPPMAHLPQTPLRPRGCYQQIDRGLPFSDGQQLPQFNFRMPSSQQPSPILPTPGMDPNRQPLFSRLGPKPQPQQQSFNNSALTQTMSPGFPASPWNSKMDAGAVHAFQIQMPSCGSPSSLPTTMAPSVSSTTSSTSITGQPKTLLANPLAATGFTAKVTTLVQQPVNTSIQKAASRSLNSSSEAHSDPEEEVQLDFKPVIPLPAEVTVCTGEETEKVLFEERGKLFRFLDKEWRERGIGVIKLLINAKGKVRLLMRRDQVLKICANHYISGSMELLSMKDKAFIWAAQDFADEEVKLEKFCIRFKSHEAAYAFKLEFEKAVENAKKADNSQVEESPKALKLPSTSAGFGGQFKQKAGTWTCLTCLVTNDETKAACLCCDTPKPGSSLQTKITVFGSGTSMFGGVSLLPAAENSGAIKSTFIAATVKVGFGDSFKPKAGSWTCSVCLINNDENRNSCAACETPKPGATVQNKAIVLSSGTDQFGGMKLSDKTTVVTSSSSHTPASNLLSQFAMQLKDSPKVVFGGFSFASTPVVQELKENPKPLNLQEPKQAESKSSPFSNFKFQLGPTTFGTPSASHVFGTNSEVTSLSFGALPTTESQGFQKDKNFKGFPQTGANLFSASPETRNQSKDTPEEFEPNVDFAPAIPLPELIDTKTGEENEEKLFGDRAKLYRYDADLKEWKERGLGELKILRHKRTSRYRLLMRRDQVHKLCANHYIIPGIKLNSMSSSDRAWTWITKDFSDGELKTEPFAAKFKNSEIAQQFRKIFEQCQHDWNEGEESSPKGLLDLQGAGTSKSTSLKDTEVGSLSEMSHPETESWECSSCYAWNKGEVDICANCVGPKPPSVVKSWSQMSKSASGSWECSTCLIRNAADKTSCLACDTPKPGSTNTVPESTSSAETPKGSQTPKFSALAGFKFGMPSSATENPAKFTFGSAVQPDESVSNQLNFGCMGKTTTKGSSEQSLPFSFGSTPVKKTPTFGTGFATTSTDFVHTPPSFGMPFNFFGSQDSSSKSLEFRFGSPQKYEFNFSGVRPRSPNKMPKSPGTPSDVSRDLTDDEPEPSDADNIFFQPVIPLPPKVDVKTGEEGEEVLYCQRAKVYRFDQGEWKERGVGDFKILHNSSTKSVRLLMRREQVLKVCINHCLTSQIQFLPKGDKTWLWLATDFSDSEPHPEQFALRFKKPEYAEQFKKAIDEAHKLLASGGSSASSPPSRPFSAIENFSHGAPSSLKTSEQASESVDRDEDSMPASDSSIGETSTLTTSASTFSFRQDKKPSPGTWNFSLASRFGTAGGSGKSIFGNDLVEKVEEDSDDIIVVYEKMPSPEQLQKALRLQLPLTFYLYEDKEPCPGCRGCRDEIPERETGKSEVSEDSDSSQLNKFDSAEVECIHQKTPTSTEIQLAEKLLLPSSFYLYKDKQPCPGCRGCDEHKPTEEDEQEKEEDETGPEMDSLNSKEPMFDSKSMSSFAQLAAGSSSSLASKTQQGSSKAIFSGAGTPLFASSVDGAVAKTENSADDDQVEASPDIHFEPVLPLPELVDIKTGEEEETPIFCERLKLYRYDNNSHQWKERGIGELKILQHKEKRQFRLLLRREQVHKVVCNHYINKEMTVNTLNNSELTLCWPALDFSEGSLTTETFAARFKNKDMADDFKVKVEECKRLLEEVETEEEEQSETKDDDDDDEEIMFEKRVDFAVSNTTSATDYKSVGMGVLKVLYDDTVFGARVKVIGDGGDLLGDNVIAVQTCLRIQDKQAFWTAVDVGVDPPVRKHFRATFASVNALDEFKEIFDEGKQYAIQSVIVEEQDHLPSH